MDEMHQTVTIDTVCASNLHFLELILAAVYIYM